MKKKILLPLTVLTSFAMNSHAMPPEIEFEGTTYRRLDSEALASAFRSQEVTFKGVKNFGEAFFKSGSYLLSGPRAPVHGVYIISNNKLCVQYDDKVKSEKCFTVFKSDQGRYLKVPIAESGTSEPPIEILIKPLNE